MAEAKPFPEHHLSLRPHQPQLHLLQQHSVQQTSASWLPKFFIPLRAAILCSLHRLNLQPAYNVVEIHSC